MQLCHSHQPDIVFNGNQILPLTARMTSSMDFGRLKINLPLCLKIYKYSSTDTGILITRCPSRHTSNPSKKLPTTYRRRGLPHSRKIRLFSRISGGKMDDKNSQRLRAVDPICQRWHRTPHSCCAVVGVGIVIRTAACPVFLLNAYTDTAPYTNLFQ